MLVCVFLSVLGGGNPINLVRQNANEGNPDISWSFIKKISTSNGFGGGVKINWSYKAQI